MYRYNYMGPRGRRTGHGGFLPGFLLGLVGLMFGGWVVLAVFGAILGVLAMFVGPMIGVFASGISWIFNSIFSGSGFALGIVIGLVWYFTNKKKNNSSRNDDDNEEEYFETRHYNSYGA